MIPRKEKVISDTKNEEFREKRHHVYRVKDSEIRTSPQIIKSSSPILSLDFHPLKDFVLLGCSDGSVRVYEYSCEENKEKLYLGDIHTRATNRAQFTDLGDSIISVSSDKSMVLYDFYEEKYKWRRKDAHESVIETCLQCDDKILATGDRNGGIKCWDFRQNKKIFNFEEHEETITKFDYNDSRKTLYACGMDGRLSVYDLKKGKLFDISGYAFNSASYVDVLEVNNGGNVVCATDDGCLDTFFYGKFYQVANRLTKHRNQRENPSFESLCFLTEEMIAGAHTNGYIGLYDVSKSDRIRHVGGLGKFNSIRIHNICLTSDGKYLGSCDDENKVRFWHVSFVFTGKNWWEDFEVFEDEEKDRKRKRHEEEYDLSIVKQVKKKTKINSKSKIFFSDLS